MQAKKDNFCGKIKQKMKVIVAADHGGFQAKENAKKWLTKWHYEVIDAGAETMQPTDDFPDMVAAAVKQWQKDPQAKMLLWCRSGAGVCIAANRYPGVFCGLGTNEQQVAAATRDDHLNALAIAADFVNKASEKLMIRAFLTIKPSNEERFVRRLKKIDEYGKNAWQEKTKKKTTADK